jgi:hypothetical protein
MRIGREEKVVTDASCEFLLEFGLPGAGRDLIIGTYFAFRSEWATTIL